MENEPQLSVGVKYGRLTVLEIGPKRGPGHSVKCQCDCGGFWSGRASSLGKNTNSCGCLKRNLKVTHGRSRRGGTRLYSVWRGMIARCYDVKHEAYHRYGGRGIIVCDEWKNDVAKFCEWAEANGHESHLTLDRKESNGNYEPDNCRWITRKEQNRNRRDNVYVVAWGESKLLSQWMEDHRVVPNSKQTLRYRLYKFGWATEEALTTPARPRLPNGQSKRRQLKEQKKAQLEHPGEKNP